MPDVVTTDPARSELVDEDGVAIVFSDEELSAQALAADRDAPLDADATPFVGEGSTFPTLLPDWYMPVPATSARKRWHVAVVGLVIAAFALINGLGLCITYGHLVVA